MDDIVTRLYCSYSDPPCEECTFCVARAEIERLILINKNLRILGDRLYVHLDAQFGIMNPAPYEIDKSIFLWREYRHDS